MTHDEKVAILADPIARIKLGHISYHFRIVMNLSYEDLAQLAGISVHKLREFEKASIGGDPSFFAVEDAERLAVVIGYVGDNVEKVEIPRFKNFEEMWEVADESFPSDIDEVISRVCKLLDIENSP